MTVNLRTYVYYDYYAMNMAMVETLSCSLQTRNTKFLIAPRLNQVSMSMCLTSFENKLQSVCWFY